MNLKYNNNSIYRVNNSQKGKHGHTEIRNGG